MNSFEPVAESGRLVIVDMARTAALVGMVVFHAVRDLEMFGVIPPGTTLDGGWALFARLVAGSFLFLVGISLVLAHGNRLRPRALLRRVGVIFGAAALVSAGTYFIDPDRFVYFGILHAIATASLLAGPFVRAPILVLIVVAAVILAISLIYGRSLELPPWMGWSGLAIMPRPALDLIPVVPWVAVTFLGMAFARLVPIMSWPRPTSPLALVLALPGRHSLLIYLIHQPVLLGLIWTIVQIAGLGMTNQ